jgi:PAS domain S-box-containing protein
MKEAFLFSALLITWFGAIAQTEKMSFKKLTPEMGLSHGDVICFYQDHEGYMWIGTADGLNKYDGVTFTVYKHKLRDSTSLPNSCVVGIYEDRKNNLWVATATPDGLCRYNRETDNFEKIFYTDDRNNKLENIINTFFEDNTDKLWVSTSNGIFWFDTEKKIFHPCFTDTYGKDILVNFNEIHQDKSGILWFISEDQVNGGIIKYNPVTEETDRYNTQHPIFKLKENPVYSFLIDNQDNIWIGGYSTGLTMINEHSKTIINYQKEINNHNSLSNNFVQSLELSSDGKIFIGTNGGGLNIFDPLTKKFEHYTENEEEGSVLSSTINTIYRGKDGIMWLACWGRGINIYDKRYEKFTQFKYDEQTGYEFNVVTDFAEDLNGNIWIATDGRGITWFNPNEKKFVRHLSDMNNPQTLTNNKVLAVETDKNGGLWVGMWQGGINYFQIKGSELILKKKFRYVDENDPRSNSIFRIVRNNAGEIWVGNFETGAYLFDPKTEEFKLMFSLKDTTRELKTNSAILDILTDSQGDVWFATLGKGLIRFNRKTGKYESYTHNEKDSTSIISDGINVVFEDSEKRLWVGSSGLSLFNRKTNTFTHFTTDQGLPDNTINGILEDNHHNLWISSNNGISKATIVTANEKPELKFRNYSIQDGLQNQVFSKWAFLKSRNGEMYFGGISGFNVFNPDSVKDNPYIPPVHITDFLLFNKPVTIGAKNSPLKIHISQTREIVLKYNQSFLTFRFIALNYIKSEKNQYAYKMEGFDKEWNYVGTKREATYTNLNPGGYTFRVKASNNDGIWNESGASVKITILPPWWQTWIFRILVLSVLLFSIYGYINYRTNRLMKQKILLTKKVRERTAQLEEANNTLQEKQEEITAQNEELQLARKELEQRVKERTADLSHANRMLKMLSECNQVLVRTTEEPMLLHKICSIIVDWGGYRMAWVGYAEPDTSKTVRPVAVAGFEEGYLNTAKINWADNERGKGPTGRAIRSGQPCIASDIQTDPSFVPWREEAKRRGYASSISLPLRDEHRVFGALVIYAELPDAFQSEEINLLMELAGDLAFGITSLQERAARERAEEKLKVLSHAVEQSPAMIIITNTEGIIEYINPEFTTVTGYSMEEVIGKKPNILKSGKMPEIFYKDLWDTLKSNKTWYGEMINKTKDGKFYWVNSSVSPIIDNDGNVLHYVGLAEDITAKKITEQDLIIAKEHAEESDRLKTAFLQNMSHEIRTPLNAIVGFSALLTNPDTSVEEKELFNSMIMKSSESLLMLIDDILDMSKIQANQLTILKAPVNVTEILLELFASFRLQAQNKGIELIMDTDTCGDNLVCYTDPYRFKQILSNLITNALKFTEKGSVKFGVSGQIQDFITFYVKDSGIGIPKEVGNSIFERFLKVEPTMTKLYGGVGLGLAICNSLVKAMGGKIWYESNLGQGTTFYFTLPWVDNEYTVKPVTRDKPGRNKIPDLSDKHLLIAEDEETNYLLLVFCLTKTKAKLTWAKNGLEALEHVKSKTNFDLILMDLKMPGMDGLEATRLIRQINPKQLIVAQTAFAFKEEKVEFLKYGFNGYIDKPIIMEKLLDTINEVFNR